MSITNPRVLVSDAIVASPAGASETVVCSLAGVTTRDDSGVVLLDGYVNFAAGTSAVGCQLTIRRGADTAGHVVKQTNDISVGASNGYAFAVRGYDTPGEVAGQEYVLTMTVTGATAASGIAAVSLSATY